MSRYYLEAKMVKNLQSRRIGCSFNFCLYFLNWLCYNKSKSSSITSLKILFIDCIHFKSLPNGTLTSLMLTLVNGGWVWSNIQNFWIWIGWVHFLIMCVRSYKKKSIIYLEIFHPSCTIEIQGKIKNKLGLSWAKLSSSPAQAGIGLYFDWVW